MDWRALTVISAIGVLGLLWHRRELRHLASRRLPTEWLFCLVMLAVAVRLANRAVGPLEHIDAGLYHLSSIRLRREGDLSSGFVMDVEDPAELFKSYR